MKSPPKDASSSVDNSTSPSLSKERRRKLANSILRQIAFHVTTLCGAGTGAVGLFNEYWIHAHGRAGLAAGVVALSSSAMAYGGALEFMLTQATGSLTDLYGRKWAFFVYPVCMLFASFLTFLFPKNLSIMWLKTVILWGVGAIFGGIAHSGAALSDICSGEELSEAYSKIFAYVGIGVLVGQYCGSKAYELTGQAKYSAFVQGVFALVQTLHNVKYLEETHPVSKRRKNGLTLSDCNPFRFIKLLTVNPTLTKLALHVPFAHCAEGKHTSAIRDMWIQDDLHFSLPLKATFMSFWSTCAVLGGLVGAKLMSFIGRRRFTSFTTFLNACGFYLISRSDIPHSIWIGNLLMLPGFNANHCSAIKSYATDHAVKAGFGKGEFAAAIAIMRGISVIISTPIYSYFYRIQKNQGQTPRMAWFSVIFFGALMPEILHRMCTDEELEIHKTKR